MAAESQDINDVSCLARAIAAELKRMYPNLTTKYVSVDLECTPQAAKNLLNGHLSGVSMGKIILAYGPGWMAERVFEAANTTLEVHLEKQAAEAERAAALAREKARNARERLARYQAAHRGSADLDRHDADRSI